MVVTSVVPSALVESWEKGKGKLQRLHWKIKRRFTTTGVKQTENRAMSMFPCAQLGFTGVKLNHLR